MDLINDALAVLDVLSIPSFHIVGFGFGGSLACELAASPSRSRVKSLTLLWSSPTGLCTEPEDGLPLGDVEGRNIAHARIMAYPKTIDWKDRYSAVVYMGYVIQLKSGRAFSHGEKLHMWNLLNRAFDRAAQANNTLESSFNHLKFTQVRWPREILQFIRCPTLIVHSVKNGLGYPLEHASALKGDITGSVCLYFDQDLQSPGHIWRETTRSILDTIEMTENHLIPPEQIDPTLGQERASSTRASTPISVPRASSSGGPQTTNSRSITPAMSSGRAATVSRLSSPA